MAVGAFIGAGRKLDRALERVHRRGATSRCIGGIPAAGFDEALDAVAELI